ncbi:type II CAAX endopeptidase family protein [Georgenia phoenicis]|uniref:CPBP family intramembrane glutamic endopeptidase n=1 Tax=unclassified Georgenia TaxID=2626815 RepID=UPI0039B0F0A9
MRLAKQLGTVVVVAALGSAAVQVVQGSWLLTLAAGVTAALLMLLTYRWVVRRTEQRPPHELGRAGAVAGFGQGLGIGVLLFAVVIGVIALAGGYRVEGWGAPAAALGYLGITTAAVATEELVFRGIVQRLLEERVGTWVALAVTAVLFGAMHLVNPNATLWGAVAIAIEAGGMLGAAFVLTRTLWLPMGLHFGWNIAAGGIFGTEVSGSDTPQGLLEGVPSGPVLLTGGAFGPEGSVVAVVACSLVTAVLLLVARRRGRIVPRRRPVLPATTATVSA